MKESISLFVPFFTAKISAQNNFHLGLNGGYVLQGPSKGLFDGGENAQTIGLDASYSISSIFRIGFLTGYLNFPNYKIYSSGIVPAQSNIILPSGTYGYSTLNNTSAKVYQIALGVTYVNTSSQTIHPILFFYSGLYFFRYTNYDYTTYWLNGTNYILPAYTKTMPLTRGFASLSFGYQFPLSDRLSLSLQGVYTFTFDRSNRTQDFIPILLGIEYSF